MPDKTPVTPPAAEPVTPPTAEPVKPPAAEPVTPPADTYGQDDPLLQQIFADLGIPSKKADKKEPEPDVEGDTDNPETEIDEGAKPAAGEKAKPAKDEPPTVTKVVKRKPEQVREVVQAETAKILDEVRALRQPPKEEPAKAPEPAKKDEPDTSEWDQDELDEYEFFKLAATVDPDKYKDAPKKFAEARAKITAWIEKKMEEDPDREFGEDDDEFNQFVDSAFPAELRALRNSDRERTRIMIQDQLRAAAPELQKPALEKLSEVERRVAAATAAPKIEQSMKFTDEAINRFVQASGAKEIVEKALAAPTTKIGSIMVSIRQQANQAAQRFITACHDETQRLNPQNEADLAILRFIQQAGEQFVAGKQGLERDGRKFLPMKEYFSMPDEQKAGYWTFDERDVLNIIALDTASRLKGVADIAAEVEEFRKAGGNGDKQKQTGQQAQTKKAAQLSSRPSVVSPTPIPATGGEPAKQEGALTAEERAALGISSSY